MTLEGLMIVVTIYDQKNRTVWQQVNMYKILSVIKKDITVHLMSWLKNTCSLRSCVNISALLIFALWED